MSELKILVVDDEPHIIRSLTFVLAREGYDVSSATDGEEAIKALKSLKPNLLLLDVMMPNKNGYEVCEDVRSNPDLSDIYIIMLTAKGQVGDKEKGLSVGANEFITKPFSPSQIVSRVNDILR